MPRHERHETFDELIEIKSTLRLLTWILSLNSAMILAVLGIVLQLLLRHSA